MAKALEEVLEMIHEQDEQEVKQQFAVTDLESAAEASRRIAYFNDRMNEIQDIVEKQIEPFMKKIEKIKEWGEEAQKEYIEKIEQYSQMLEMFMREEVNKQIEAGKKPKKTITLPYGKISLKAQQPEFEKDEKLLLEYAKKAGFTKTVVETKWNELKKTCAVINGKLVDSDGVVVPGVIVKERDDKFSVKLN